jgi:hypothetical protein
MIAPAEEIVRGITLNFCLLKYHCCNENGDDGGCTAIMVKLVGCRPWLWVVLLQISWAWNMSHISSKNVLILCKKNHPLFHLAHPKYPYILHKYPFKKWGM